MSEGKVGSLYLVRGYSIMDEAVFGDKLKVMFIAVFAKKIFVRQFGLLRMKRI